MKKKRLDQLLVDRELAVDLREATALLMKGVVLVNDQKLEKPGTRVAEDAVLRILGTDQRYVSRGGLKLEAAIVQFKLELDGLVCADLGASTGGFTDCLLQHGARRVYAFDVGKGLLHWRLQTDERVIIQDRFNVRNLRAEDIPEPVDLVTADLSFISLRQILPTLTQFPSARFLVLVKPQFEAERWEVEPGGLVTDPDKRAEILTRVITSAEVNGFEVLAQMESPVSGQKGNIECLLYLRLKDEGFTGT